MTRDMRRYNGGPRKGAGRPKTVDGWHQVAARIPEDMARWFWRQPDSAAEVLRRLIKEAMDRDLNAAKLENPATKGESKHTQKK